MLIGCSDQPMPITHHIPSIIIGAMQSVQIRLVGVYLDRPMPCTYLVSSDHYPNAIDRNRKKLFSSIMTCVPITNLFNAYDLQLNPLDEDKIRSQEVVNYCKVRFRVALQEMMRRSEQDQTWMFKVLFREMVF